MIVADEERYSDDGALKVRFRNVLILYLLEVDCVAEGDASSEAALHIVRLIDHQLF